MHEATNSSALLTGPQMIYSEIRATVRPVNQELQPPIMLHRLKGVMHQANLAGCYE
jgi:hypothetical protein